MGAAFTQKIDDQREQARTTTVYRPILVETSDIAAFCLLRNISTSGMMAKSYVDFAEETAIEVTFGCDFSAEGRVVWSRNRQIGIQFDNAVDVPQLLERLSHGGDFGLPKRAPRLQMRSAAHVSLDGRQVPVELLDISQNGVKVRTPYLKPLDEVTIELQGMALKWAVVRWTQAGIAGLRFLVPLSFDQLGEWVIDQQIGREKIPKNWPDKPEQKAVLK